MRRRTGAPTIAAAVEARARAEGVPYDDDWEHDLRWRVPLPGLSARPALGSTMAPTRVGVSDPTALAALGRAMGPAWRGWTFVRFSDLIVAMRDEPRKGEVDLIAVKRTWDGEAIGDVAALARSAGETLIGVEEVDRRREGEEAFPPLREYVRRVEDVVELETSTPVTGVQLDWPGTPDDVAAPTVHRATEGGAGDLAERIIRFAASASREAPRTWLEFSGDGWERLESRWRQERHTVFLVRDEPGTSRTLAEARRRGALARTLAWLEGPKGDPAMAVEARTAWYPRVTGARFIRAGA